MKIKVFGNLLLIGLFTSKVQAAVLNNWCIKSLSKTFMPHNKKM